MNEIREFIEELKDSIMQTIPEELTQGLTLTDTIVTKVNDQKLYGLSFQMEGTEAAPTIYVNQFYDRYRQGDTMQHIAIETAHMYLDTLSHPAVVKETPDLSFDKIKDNLTLKLVEIKRNRSYLSDIPYMTVGNGLAAVCDIRLDAPENEGVWSTTVTKQMMETYHYDKSEVFRQAMMSAREVDPPTMMSMGGRLFETIFSPNMLADDSPVADADKEPMYVLSNESGVYGAATLFYPGMQEQVADKLGESYYALPSSLHEFLIVPESAGVNLPNLSEMVKTANETVVEAKDVLSDTVLHYDRDEKKLESIAHAPVLEARQAEAR